MINSGQQLFNTPSLDGLKYVDLSNTIEVIKVTNWGIRKVQRNRVVNPFMIWGPLSELPSGLQGPDAWTQSGELRGGSCSRGSFSFAFFLGVIW
jgi:hypothetical protein